MARKKKQQVQLVKYIKIIEEQKKVKTEQQKIEQNQWSDKCNCGAKMVKVFSNQVNLGSLTQINQLYKCKNDGFVKVNSKKIANK